MRESELSVAGKRWTTAKSLPGPLEMRPTAIWHEETQLILLTFPLVNKYLEIAGPKAWVKETPFIEEAPNPTSQIKGWGTLATGTWP